MEYVIKRNGVKAPFDKSKIVNAIEKAMTTTPGGIDSRVSNAIADHIAEMPDTLSVEQIQDIVIEQLKASPFADVAESYSHWRKLRQEIRDKEKTNASILEIIDAKNDAINQENSNKNPTVNSVQRDYMAGEVSKDLTARLLLDPEIVKAHEEGLIHFHDADYFAQHMHNCFKSNTRFVTDSGVKEFRDFNDGETVKVVGSDGKWHTATVKKYGKQKMQDVMLQAGDSHSLNRLYNEIVGKDWFMALLDLRSYIQTKEKALADYDDRYAWAEKMLVNIANAGFFSSDRTIKQYNEDIWHL